MTEPDLTLVSGIGSASANALRAAGFSSIQSIAEADTGALSQVPGFGPTRAASVKAAAAKLLGQAGDDSASDGRASAARAGATTFAGSSPERDADATELRRRLERRREELSKLLADAVVQWSAAKKKAKRKKKRKKAKKRQAALKAVISRLEKKLAKTERKLSKLG